MFASTRFCNIEALQEVTRLHAARPHLVIGTAPRNRRTNPISKPRHNPAGQQGKVKSGLWLISRNYAVEACQTHGPAHSELGELAISAANLGSDTRC